MFISDKVEAKYTLQGCGASVMSVQFDQHVSPSQVWTVSHGKYVHSYNVYCLFKSKLRAERNILTTAFRANSS